MLLLGRRGARPTPVQSRSVIGGRGGERSLIMDGDDECCGSTLDVERIPQPAAALFGFELLVGDIAWCRFQPYSTRLIDAYPSAGG
jgi:hypothetical protein